MLSEIYSLRGAWSMWIHALLGSAGAQASSFRHIRPEHLNNSLPYVSKLEALPHRCMCSLFTLSGDGGASIHGLSGTEDVRASRRLGALGQRW